MGFTMKKELTGRKFALIICSMFAIIIGVNLTLAYNAVATFPGLEAKNSYVASQNFNRERAAQEALGWDVSAVLDQQGQLRLTFDSETGLVQPEITYAVLGRATSVAQDQTPEFIFDGQSFLADVDLGDGNWNLRLRATAADGTQFKQRVIVEVLK